jgi:bacterioferritin
MHTSHYPFGAQRQFITKQSIDEMRHAKSLIDRILFLDGTPSLTEPMQLSIGSNLKQQLESNLKLEIAAVAINVARDEGDNASRELFERLLKNEEEHIDCPEAQVHQIQEMGYERYLGLQIGDEK